MFTKNQLFGRKCSLFVFVRGFSLYPVVISGIPLAGYPVQAILTHSKENREKNLIKNLKSTKFTGTFVFG